MGTKDNGKDRESDLSNVFPDLKTMQRDADPSRRRARLEEALNTPPVVDAALTILRQGLKPGEDPLYYEVPQREGAPDSGAPGPCTSDADAAPSPWADDAGVAVPKELLPSAGGVPAPVPAAVDATRARRTRRPGRLLSAVIALLAVLGPIFVMWLVVVRPHGSGESRQATSARPSAEVAPPPATATGVPTAGPPSSAVVAPPAPSASVDVGAATAQSAPAVAPPAPSVKPKTRPPGAKRSPPKDGAKSEDDPETFK